ncbi:MAG: tripartite tricarboxylate transporter TctB family protein [Alphaproteobacteria bacterium]|nr:tripartite tricarboxylate transporter TctB family protein [Alphaproteobacteria bacterium]
MPLAVAKSEFWQLIVLLLADAVYLFVIIPLGIQDPEGFGIDQGLPPSFSARLAALLAAALMLLRLAQLRWGSASEVAPAAFADSDTDNPAGLPLRGLTGMVVALAFSIVLVPLVGFYAGAVVLLLVLGERSWPRLVLYPAIVTLLVWGLFAQLLSIRLPSGTLFGS